MNYYNYFKSITIDNSTFDFNTAAAFSSCLFFQGDYLKIESIFFLLSINININKIVISTKTKGFLK